MQISDIIPDANLPKQNQGPTILPGIPRLNNGQHPPIPQQNLIERQIEVDAAQAINNQYTFTDFASCPEIINNQNPQIMVIDTIIDLQNLALLCQNNQLNELQRTLLTVTRKLDCRQIPTYTECGLAPNTLCNMSVIQGLCSPFFQANPLFPLLNELQLGDIYGRLSLSNLTQLTTLTIGNVKFNPISGPSEVTLADLPNLTTLTIGDLLTFNDFPAAFGNLNFENLPNLTTVSLGVVFGSFLNLSTIPQLTTLTIEGIIDHLALINFPHLTSLTLGSYRRTVLPSQLTLQNVVNLATLTISSNETNLYLDSPRLLNLIAQNIRDLYNIINRDDGSVELKKINPRIENVNNPAARVPLGWELRRWA